MITIVSQALIILAVASSNQSLFELQKTCSQADPDRRLRACTTLIKTAQLKNSDLAWTYHKRGIAKRLLGDIDGAIEDYTKAIQLAPKSAGSYFNRGNAKSLKGNLDAAIKDYTRAIALHPRYEEAYRVRGFLRFFKARYTLAMNDLAKSYELRKSTGTALWLTLARLRSGVPGTKELEESSKSLPHTQWPTPIVRLYLGHSNPSTVLRQAEQISSASYLVRRCDALFFVGEWHLFKGENAKAIKILRKARDECPKSQVEYHGAVYELRSLGIVE